MKTVVVNGGGYVGLTGAIHACLAGYNVIIYDPDPSVVWAINEGKPKANEYLSYFSHDIKNLISQGRLSATTSYDSIKEERVHFVAVPTERDNEPYFDIVKKVVLYLSWSAPAGSIIIIESTLQPGVTDEIIKEANPDQYIAVCPRLDWFADKEKNLTNLPRIVGGVNEESTSKAAEILAPICKNIYKTNYRVAEMAKAGQNALYFAQIMAAYEMAKEYQGFVDMNEVLKAIGLHWRLPNLYLGPGTSGRCVAMGARYITEGAKYRRASSYMPILETALNKDILWRELMGDQLTRHFNFPKSEDAEFLVMGIAYSPNFSDFGYSAGLGIATYLDDHAFKVSIHDPIVSKEEAIKTFIPFEPLSKKFDAILLATGHDQYRDLPLNIDLWKKDQIVLDATGLWEKYRGVLKSYGVKYIRVGEQGWMNK